MKLLLFLSLFCFGSLGLYVSVKTEKEKLAEKLNLLLPPMKPLVSRPEITTLAPPPINFEEEHVMTNRGAYTVTYRDNTLDIHPDRPDREPDYPYIVQVPGKEKYWVKPGRGKPWVKAWDLEGKLFKDVMDKVRKLMSGWSPPPPAGHNGNGNGHGGNPSPFIYGDLVKSKSHPNYGVLFVTKCILQSDHTWYVTTIYSKAPDDLDLSQYKADSDDFQMHFDPE